MKKVLSALLGALLLTQTAYTQRPATPQPEGIIASAITRS